MGLTMKRVRVLAWIVLYAFALRTFGGAVGIWAAGSLTVLGSLLVGVVTPIWCFLFGPTWLGWRLVEPRAGGRLPRLVVAASWLSPLVRATDLASLRVFLDTLGGRPLPPATASRADAWVALGALAQAERQGDRPRAERILDALTHLPPGSRFPWAARVYGVDTLVGAALERRDDGAAIRIARLGVGRLARLVSALAEGAPGRSGGRFLLWAWWALSPMRRRTYRMVRAAAARPASGRPVIPPPAAHDAGDVRLRHLRLLDAAERAGSIRLAEVFALADAWQTELDEAALARVRARALELGARDGEGRTRALRALVLDELVELAAAAEGQPVSAPTSTALGRELHRRLRERLAARVAASVEGLRPRLEPPSLDPLAVWERWLVLRDAVEAFESHAGPSGLGGLWYGGVRDAVWGTSAALCEPSQPRSPWAAHMMFSWIADQAELLGDIPATLANRENARRALTRR
jgi:hypothetical protein